MLCGKPRTLARAGSSDEDNSIPGEFGQEAHLLVLDIRTPNQAPNFDSVWEAHRTYRMCRVQCRGCTGNLTRNWILLQGYIRVSWVKTLVQILQDWRVPVGETFITYSTVGCGYDGLTELTEPQCAGNTRVDVTGIQKNRTLENMSLR